MKPFALALALALQLTGLWTQLPTTVRDRIAAKAVTMHPATATLPAPVLAPPAITSLSLPLRTGTEPLNIPDAGSVIAVDVSTGTTLYAQNATKQRPIASVTKLTTALVILSRHQANESVTIGQLPSYPSDAELLGLQPGETYRLGDLVRAALVISANDAADALAIYDSGSITKFAAQMNLRLADWNISGAHFSNPSGLQDQGNYATADALSRIALLALASPSLRQTVSLPNASLTSTNGRTLSGPSTNKLLATGRYYGIKTGYTLAAGECFVGLTKIDGHEVITVVLGSSDRFGDTESLVTWISHNYQWL